MKKDIEDCTVCSFVFETTVYQMIETVQVSTVDFDGLKWLVEYIYIIIFEETKVTGITKSSVKLFCRRN